MKRQLSVVVALVAAALTVVPVPVLAQQGTPATPSRQARSADIRIDADGAVRGRLINSSGVTIDGAKITMMDGEKTVATTMTDAKGQFAFPKVAAGEKTFVTPQGAQTVRLWKAAIAPPTAQKELNLIAVDPAVRGQFGILQGGVFNTVLGVTGVVLSAVAIDKISDLDDKVSSLQTNQAALQDDITSIQDTTDQILRAVSP